MSIDKDNGRDRPIALITGGAKGLGYELSKVLAEQGHDLVLVGRNENALRQASERLSQSADCKVVFYSLDLSQEQGPLELFNWLQEKKIEVDVLVNNAGSGSYGRFADSDLDILLKMQRLNMQTPSMLTRLLLPGMMRRGRGRILNLASLVAYYTSGPSWSAYVATKHYVLALTRGLAEELAGSGVSTTALCPGPIDTEFSGLSGVNGTRLYRWLPKVDSEKIARAGIRGMMKGRTVVIPGFLNNILAFLGELPPRVIAQAVFSFLLRGSPNPSPSQEAL
ncbi:MAG: SDR family oxidoreductase [Candidatus Thiodiazotropha sp. L084R]